MVEKKYLEIPPTPFTANGTSGGLVTVLDSSIVKVKQNLLLESAIVSSIAVEVKQVLSPTTFLVGPKGGAMIDNYTDISSLLVANGAFFLAQTQNRPTIDYKDVLRAVYDEEPTVALRTVLVDMFGDRYDANNPFPVNATVTIPPITAVVDLDAFTKNPPDNAIAVGTEDGTKTGTRHALQVDSNLDLHVAIANGPNKAIVNADGSFDVNVVNPGGGTSKPTKNTYNTAAAVATGTLTTVTTYTVPAGKTAILEKITASGDNVARFHAQLNGTDIDVQRTYFGGGFNVNFDFVSSGIGQTLNAGDVVRIQVLHNSPNVGAFNARIQVVESS